jgi:protein deglycase
VSIPSLKTLLKHIVLKILADWYRIMAKHGVNMKRKAIIILADGFEEIEAITVIDVLRRAGVEVSVCGLDEKMVKGSKGIVIEADKRFEGNEDGCDACILPGGMPGAENLASSNKLKNILLDINEQGKIIAAICAAPAIVLAPLGILDNRSATCYPGMEDGFSDTTDYKENDVVIDDNIITSRGPATALKFAIAIVNKLCGESVAQKIASATLLHG